MTIRPETIEELRLAVGELLGPSDWVTLDQARIDAFAEVTGDRQWIHVDPGRAADGPFQGTIAHGYLTLSLTPTLMDQLTGLRDHCVSINYGLNRLRFLTPVRAGSRVRARARVVEVRDRPPEGVLAVFEVSYELEGQTRPALVAETLSLLIPRPGAAGNPS